MRLDATVKYIEVAEKCNFQDFTLKFPLFWLVIFNVDFDRCSSLTRLLRDFMSEMSLHACDLSFHSSVKFTFERGDGLACSWIDHILCSKPFSTLVTNVHTLFSGYLITFHFASYSKFIA